MNRVAIQEFQFLRRCRNPGLHQSRFTTIDVKGSMHADDIERNRIEELVGKDDRESTRRGNVFVVCLQYGETRLAGVESSHQCLGNSLAQRRRLLDQFVSQRPKEVRKLLLRPIHHVLREESASRTKFPDHDALRRAHHTPHLVKLPRQQTSEYSMHIARRVEVARLAELLRVARVIAKFRIVKAKFHVSRKWNWTAISNFLFNLPPQFAHSPFFCRSIRSCGVRINISTK